MRRLILPFALATAAAAALTGCGNKGDLFLPPPPAATTVAPKSATPAAPSATPVEPARASSSLTPFNSVSHQ